MVKSTLIFDLDGTLIDSSGSILTSFEHALHSLGLTAQTALTPALIGPPLMHTLALISGTQDPPTLQMLAQQFKAHYDDEACKQATVFSGVVSMLDTLYATDSKIYIATNKRLFPTLRILHHLGWHHYFSGVYALDFFTPALANKKQMIGRMLNDEAIAETSAIYIGDRYEDGVAADGNRLEFAMVNWGYLDETMGEIPSHWQLYETPDALTERLLNRHLQTG